MNPTIHLATTDAEREAVFRLRYEIYVEEMHIFGAVADHTRRTFTDPNDPAARLMYAMVDDKVVGTMRLNFGKDAPFSEEFEETYGMGAFRKVVTDDQMFALTRFMVTKDLRGSTLPFKLIRESAVIALQEGIEMAVCDCQPHLINLYSRLGFRSYDCPVYNDPEFGIMVPLAFVIKDMEYLRRIRSPLRSVMAQPDTNNATTQRLIELLGTAAIRGAVPEEDDNSWGEMYGLLNEDEGDRTHVFDGLSEDEVQSLVARGHIIECAPGDRIIREGQVACTVFVVLSGTLEVRNKDYLIALATQGDVVGELAFLLARQRTADVHAGPEGARVLSLDEQKLRQLVETPSRAAAVLLLNLSRALARKLAESTAIIRSTNDLPAPGL